jgi:hypothetical protein
MLGKTLKTLGKVALVHDLRSDFRVFLHVLRRRGKKTAGKRNDKAGVSLPR